MPNKKRAREWWIDKNEALVVYPVGKYTDAEMIKDGCIKAREVLADDFTPYDWKMTQIN